MKFRIEVTATRVSGRNQSADDVGEEIAAAVERIDSVIVSGSEYALDIPTQPEPVR